MKTSPLAVALPLIALAVAGGEILWAAAGPPIVKYPEADPGLETLPARQREQLDSAKQLKVFHEFQFRDLFKESGITFLHRIEEDAGKFYKLVHYDHGNGIAVADVDRDGLIDICFFNQVGGNEMWRNAGGGKFENITAQAGIALKDRIVVTGSFADVDNDGDQDLFVTTVRMGNVLFKNDGKGHFTDATKEAGLGYSGHSSGGMFFDYDGDGLLDLFLANVGRYTSELKHPSGAYIGLRDAFNGHLYPDRTEPSILYRNLGGGRFADVTAETGLGDKGWSGDASFADLNDDGRPDVYVLNMQGDDHYYENAGGRSFVDKTSQLFPKTPWGSMGLKFFDYNNDGLIDLFVTDMHSDMSETIGPEREKLKSRIQWSPKMLGGDTHSIFGNAMYVNRGGGKFEEASDSLGVENYWPWGPSIGDLNADGWDDIFIAASMNYPFRYGINSLLLNNQGEKFLGSEFLLGVEPRRDGRTHTPWFDVDCTSGGEGRPPCKDRKGLISVWAPLGSRSAAIFDLDNDGDLDIVTNDFNSEPMVLISDLSKKKQIKYIKVALTGTASNRDGLGSIVQVRVPGHVYTKWNDGKSGYLSQSELPLYFGLGDAAKADSIEVRWPSGKKQTVTEGLALNTTIQITEPK